MQRGNEEAGKSLFTQAERIYNKKHKMKTVEDQLILSCPGSMVENHDCSIVEFHRFNWMNNRTFSLIPPTPLKKQTYNPRMTEAHRNLFWQNFTHKVRLLKSHSHSCSSTFFKLWCLQNIFYFSPPKCLTHFRWDPNNCSGCQYWKWAGQKGANYPSVYTDVNKKVQCWY